MDSVAFWPSFLKMLLALAVVLGLLVGAMYLFRRVLQQAPGAVGGGQAINVVAARYLGPKSSIMLVEVLGKLIVVGLANNQMQHLATITDAEALEKLQYISLQEKKLPPLADALMSYRIFRSLRNRREAGGVKR